MLYRMTLCLIALAFLTTVTDAHPRRRVRTRAEAHLARGQRLIDCGQSNDALRELTLARKYGDAVVEQEATWALQRLGVDHRSVPVYTEDRDPRDPPKETTIRVDQ